MDKDESFDRLPSRQNGEVAEWSKAPHSKCGVPERAPWVRIPPSPHLMKRHLSKISHGVAHKVPADLHKVLSSDKAALAAWEDLTPLARNEWICWTISVKKSETRKEHVARVVAELKEGKRRPCCWIGCIHRTDKSISPSVRTVLKRKSKKRV